MKSIVKIIIAISALALTMTVRAGAPAWNVNAGDYQHTMTFTVAVKVDNHELTSTNALVAAFVNGVCRGVTHLQLDAVFSK